MSLNDWLSRSAYPLRGWSRYDLNLELGKIFADITLSPSFDTLLDANEALYDLPIVLQDLRAENAAGMCYADAIALNNSTARTKNPFYSPLGYKEGETLIHEFRHGFQLSNSSFGYVRSYDMRQKLLESFVLEADANAFSATVCYELKEIHKNPGYWRAFKGKHPLIASAFHQSIKQDKQNFFSGFAQKEAFLAWFTSADTVNFYANKFSTDIKKIMSGDVRKQAEKFARRKAAYETLCNTYYNSERVRLLIGPDVKNASDDQIAPVQKVHQPAPASGVMPYKTAQGELRDRSDYLDISNFPYGEEFYFLNVSDKNLRRLTALQSDYDYWQANIRERSKEWESAYKNDAAPSF